MRPTPPALEVQPIPEPADSYFRCSRAPDFFPAFYRRLLASDPAIPPMFATTDWERQHVLLRSGIVMLLLQAGGNPAAEAALVRLGRLHGPSGLGVPPALYRCWVESLVATVASYDPEFSPRIEAAWRDAAERGIAVMLSSDVTSPGSSGRTR